MSERHIGVHIIKRSLDSYKYLELYIHVELFDIMHVLTSLYTSSFLYWQKIIKLSISFL